MVSLVIVYILEVYNFGLRNGGMYVFCMWSFRPNLSPVYSTLSCMNSEKVHLNFRAINGPKHRPFFIEAACEVAQPLSWLTTRLLQLHCLFHRLCPVMTEMHGIINFSPYPLVFLMNYSWPEDIPSCIPLE